MKKSELAHLIEHTMLKPDATQPEILSLCVEAMEHDFGAVCVNPVWVEYAKQLLVGSNVKVTTVVGFPLGANASRMKAMEAQRAISDGANEVDMVLQVGMLKNANASKVRHDIEIVVQASSRRSVKVILECALLNDDEKVLACKTSMDAGAAFVKTSTGFCAAGGATVEDVRLLRATVGDKFGVKAAGGIRTLEQALAMVEAGASRLGCSASVAIIGAMES